MSQPSLLPGFEPEPFPWPSPNPDSPPAGSMHNVAAAMRWRGLTPAERCCAIFVADGSGGPGAEMRLQQSLGITREALDQLLLALLRKGVLAHFAHWWSA